MREQVKQILSKYVVDAKQRGINVSSLFDNLVPQTNDATVVQRPYSSPQVPSIGSSSANTASSSSAPAMGDFDLIAKPVLTSWLKGRGGLGRVERYNLWDKDKVGGVTANEYYRRAKQFDNPQLDMVERITQMLYGVETSGNPNAWKTTNPYGYMGRAQIGKAFMQDYGIDKNRYMSDPKYQHEVTKSAVEKRIKELKGIYY